MSTILLAMHVVTAICERLRSGDIDFALQSLEKAMDIADNDGYASTAWSIDDVIGQAMELGIGLTEDEARNFLVRNEEDIVADMIDSGWESIANTLLIEVDKKK